MRCGRKETRAGGIVKAAQEGKRGAIKNIYTRVYRGRSDGRDVDKLLGTAYQQKCNKNFGDTPGIERKAELTAYTLVSHSSYTNADDVDRCSRLIDKESSYAAFPVRNFISYRLALFFR